MSKKKRRAKSPLAVERVQGFERSIRAALDLHRQGLLNEAERGYLAILQAMPEQPDAMHYLGVIAYQKGDSGRAIDLLRRAIARHPIPEMCTNLATVLASQGDMAGALECRVRAWQLAPNDSGTAFHLAGEYLAGKQWQPAKELLEAVVRQNPNWSAASLNLANCYKNLGEREAAEAMYRRVLALDAEMPELHSNLGAFYSESDRAEDALIHHRKAVALAPDRPEFHYNLGNGYWALGRWGEAMSAYRNALLLQPNMIQAVMNLGTVLLISGDLDGALEAFKSAEKIDPHQGQIFINMGYLCHQLRRYDEALAYLKKGLELEPDSFGAWSEIAEILLDMGMCSEAREAELQSLKMESRNGMAWLGLAKIEERANRLELAEAALINALQKPSNLGLVASAADQRIDAYLRLANLYATQAKVQEAGENFRAGLDLLGEKHPGQVRCKDESGERRLVLLRPIGRSGSLFLHSLIDGHPQISTTPTLLMKGYFGNCRWDSLRPPFDDKNWREVLVERFVKTYGPLLDTSCPMPVPGNPLGRSTRIGEGTGLTTMGPNRDQWLKVNEQLFMETLLEQLNCVKEVSAPKFFEMIHQTWDRVLEWPENKPLIFFHIHNPDPTELAGCLAGFSDVRLLNIVREPLQAIESWMAMCLAQCDDAKALLYGYNEAFGRLNECIRAASHVTHGLYPSTTVRLEDIKRCPEKTLPLLANWMGAVDDPCLRQQTFGGLAYDTPASTPVRGFETSNLERKPGLLFSEADQEVLNILLYPLAVQYGYRDADELWLKEKLEWLKSRVNIPLDFERKILAKFHGFGYKGDVSAPRKYFESIAARCITLLERFGTYPAMAPWLKVD